MTGVWGGIIDRKAVASLSHRHSWSTGGDEGNVASAPLSY
jgi:hypothetical protein